MKHGKNYNNALAQVDREELLTVVEALDKVKNLSTAKFDETVELAIRLGVDPRKAEQIVRGTISLPAGTGKTNRVVVFASGEAAQAARDAGADEVGAEDLVLHAFTDGRDTLPHAGAAYLDELDATSGVRIGSVVGTSLTSKSLARVVHGPNRTCGKWCVQQCESFNALCTRIV